MIIVKIELHSAVTGKVTELGRVHIINDGTHPDPNRGNYNVKKLGKNRRLLGEARVENHARWSNPIFRLVRKALEALGV